jgi:formylglycine-generating enzyme required for sulfatase activity
VLAAWATGRWRSGTPHAQAVPLPPLLRAVDGAPTVVARSLAGVRPSGYVTGLTAESACARAHKRLCSAEEFVVACRGEEDRKFPYGDSYISGACNVFRDVHPASVLHGNAAVGHLDPRLNRVLEGGQPLLGRTGAAPRCRSRWGDDGVYDLVGNLDEWLDEPKGAFAGGFYARSTRAGCDAMVRAHPRRYLDYSTGLRCCRDVDRER